MTAKRQDFYPLSPMQQGMLFHSLYAPGSGVYVEQFSCTLQGAPGAELDTAAFEHAWRHLLERHTILRTAFVGQALKEPVQVVYSVVPLNIRQEDWRAYAAPERQARLEAYRAADRRRGFDLARPPLMRLALLRTADSTYEFVWTYHHILLDGWSMPLLLSEFLACYEAYYDMADHGHEWPIPLPPTRPYRDYVAWLHKQDLAKAEAYWRRTLHGLTAATPVVIDSPAPTGLSMTTVIDGPTPVDSAGPADRQNDGDGDGAETDEGAYAAREVRLLPDVTVSLQALARRNRLTLNTLLQAAWAILLSRYSGEQDVIFGATVSGRPADLPGAESMVGLFINTLPIRVHVDEDQPLVAWLQSLQAQQAELQQYQYTPLIQIQGWSEVPRGQSLFETLMVFENYPLSSASLGAEARGPQAGAGQDAGLGGPRPGPARGEQPALQFRNIRSVEQTNYPITFVAGVDREVLLRIIYDTRRLSDASIVRMLGHLRTLLEGMAAPATTGSGERVVADLPLLTAAEQRYLLIELNNTARPDPPYLLAHQWFEAQARKTPDAVAVSFAASSRRDPKGPGDQVLTYRELNERADLLARRLRRLGVGPEVLVGLCMERSVDLIVSILAVLKAGGAYVPLDPVYPPERLAFMLADFGSLDVADSPHGDTTSEGASVALGRSGGPIVITHSDLLAVLPQEGIRALCLDTEWEAIVGEARAQVGQLGLREEQQGHKLETYATEEDAVTPDNLAYVIYTSGSTGVPKGTLLHHRGLCHVTRSFIEISDVRASSRILQFYSPSFDGSLSEIFPALLTGATLCLADRETLSSPAELWRMLREERIDVAFIAPAMWAALPTDPLPDLRVLTAGGEALPPEVVQRWLTEGRRFVNYYGPTEATIAVTYYSMSQPPMGATSLPIGRPLDNVSIYLVDSRLRLVPMGVPGELCIGGVQLARGYLNRPEMTEAKFVPMTLALGSSTRALGEGAGVLASESSPRMLGEGRDGPRIYRTGDLARYLPDGNLEFLGRIDQQVKIRGYRIELGEIEAVLGQYPGVRQVAVVAWPASRGQDGGSHGGSKRLVAYLGVGSREHDPDGAPGAARDGRNGEEPEISAGELRVFLQTKLPGYMIPSAFVTLDTLPLTPNGKVDRRALPSPEDTRAERAGRTYVAPRDALEVELTRIWEQVLDVQPIGVQDDFFELGGHSLLAVRLIAQVEQALGTKLPVMSLFQQPTIEGMAGLLRESVQSQGRPNEDQQIRPRTTDQERPDDARSGTPPSRGAPDPLILVKLQAHGARLPLYFVHPSGGSVHWYRDLAKRLGREQPFYGLQARGLEGGAPIDTRIEAMAARYVQQICLAQPQGPYQIGSWSMGVIVAYEMACQLAEAGQTVSLLAILDQGPVHPAPEPVDQAAYLVETFGQNIPLDVEALRRVSEEEQIAQVYQVARKARFIFPDVKLEQFRHFVTILRTHTEAWRSYTPHEYAGRLTLFKAEKRPQPDRGSPEPPDLGWGALARGGVEIHQVPGDHLSMVHDPDVRVLARELEACLAQARESVGAVTTISGTRTREIWRG